jgi:hypothetical protein
MPKNTNKIYFALFLIIAFLLVFLFNSDAILINLIVLFTLNRGIISQNCFWWSLNDYLPDATGSEVYRRLKTKDRFVQLNIFGQEIYLITNIEDIVK